MYLCSEERLPVIWLGQRLVLACVNGTGLLFFLTIGVLETSEGS